MMMSSSSSTVVCSSGGSKLGVRKGSWTEEEDRLLRYCVQRYGEGSWHQVPKRTGLNRCRKSCRLRWLNYLKPNIKRGVFTDDELDLIIRLHNLLGNRWSLIAGRLPGRTGNDIKNYWNTHLQKRMMVKNNDKSDVVKVVRGGGGGPNSLQVKKKDDEIIRRHEVIRPRARRLVSSSAAWMQSSHVTQTGTVDNNDDEWWENLLQQEVQFDPLVHDDQNLTNFDLVTNYNNNDADDHSNKYYYCNNGTSNTSIADINTAGGAAGPGDDDDQAASETTLLEVQETGGYGFYSDYDALQHDLWNCLV